MTRFKRNIYQLTESDLRLVIREALIAEKVGGEKIKGWKPPWEGGGGGSGGGLLSGLFGAFKGFFADGGVLGAGQWGIAGEAGPEPVVGPARIIPNRAMAGGETNVRVFFDDNGNLDAKIERVSAQSAKSEVRRATPGIVKASVGATYKRAGEVPIR